jgi:hypothetical protein
MTHEFGHTECGGLGRLLGWIKVWLKDHVVMNVAVHLKHENLIEKYDVPEADALEFGRKIHEQIQGWYDEAHERWGVPYYNYKPWPGNLKAKVHKAPK